MCLIERRAVKKLLAVICMAALLVCFVASNPLVASAIELQPMTLSREADSSVILVNQQFTVNYTVEPQPIDAPQITPPPKEFYLVIDTSGSMNYNLEGKSIPNYSQTPSRLKIAKEAANKFLDSIKGKPNVKAGLIAYDDNAIVKKQLTSNIDSVKSAVNDLTAEGGTNIGDGLRVANYELMKSGSNAEKYIVLLTDGEPTYHSCTNDSITSYKMDDGVATKIKGGGSTATEEDKTYCYKVAEELVKKNGIQSYMIAFTKGSNQNVLNLIAQKAGGIYKQALDADTLNDVYTEISYNIINDFTVQGVSFEEIIPAGLKAVAATEGLFVTDQKVSGNLPSITYHLNKDTNKYTASPVEFFVTFEAIKVGNFTLGSGQSSRFSYLDTNGSKKVQYFNELDIMVRMANSEIELDRSLIPDKIETGQKATITYKINPKPITMAKVEESEKEIVLVLDTSTSMLNALDGGNPNPSAGKLSRQQIAKDAAKNFIDSLAEKNQNNKIKVALVSFSDKAEIRSNLTTNLNSVKTAINNLPTISGTNIGDGLRRAHYILEKGNPAAEKYIVLLTDGEATYYSKKSSWNDTFYTDNQAAPSTNLDTTKAKQYSKKIVDELIKDKSYNNYFIAFTEQINILEDLANEVGGKYKMAEDDKALNSIYNAISKVVVGDFAVKNLKFYEEFPEGVIPVEAAEGLNISGRVVSGNLDDIAYIYNESTGKYTADPVEFTVSITASASGEYLLKSSGLNYVDVNNDNVARFFPQITLKVLFDPDPPFEPGDLEIEYGEPGFDVVSTRRKGEAVIVKVNVVIPANAINWSLVDKDGVPYMLNEQKEITGRVLSVDEEGMDIETLSIYNTYEGKLVYKLIDGTTGETEFKRLYTKVDVN